MGGLVFPRLGNGVALVPAQGLNGKPGVPQIDRRHGDRRLGQRLGDAVVDAQHPEPETLLLATAGAVKVLGVDHSVTKALAKASITMAKVDLWHAQLALKTLRKDQREAIAEVGEG